MSHEHVGDGSKLRPELTPLPSRMLGLPVVRGYPVPWFVDWIDGQPEFRAMDYTKLMTAIAARVCWVCGEAAHKYVSFVAGPMCGINRVSAEPPCHQPCAFWSAINCPFLNNPEFERRPQPMLKGLPKIPAAGVMLQRNPGVTMVWSTKDYTIVPVRAKGAQPGVLFSLGDPSQVDWFCRGRPATKAEVEHSIETGLPILMRECSVGTDELPVLDRLHKKFLQYLPKQ
jgi:hypothetical protein